MRLKGKAALVTGAGQGFGFGIAEAFVREGARVACLDLKGDVAEAAAKRFGGGSIALHADVSNATTSSGRRAKRSPRSDGSTSSSTTPARPIATSRSWR